MVKSELISEVAQRCDSTKVAAKPIIEEALRVIGEELSAGREVSLPGFGKFKIVSRAERMGRRPGTNEVIVIPACKAVKFCAGSEIAEKLKQAA